MNILGNYIHMIANSTATINNSSFTNYVAKTGGAIYVIGDSTLIVFGCSFY